MKLFKTDAIIQARLSSSRLPRKILMELHGKKLIEHVILRLRSSPWINRIIVATTTDPTDDDLVRFCEAKAILFFRGERDDVLARLIGAGETYGCDKIVRVCSDNPFIDPKTLDEMIESFRKNDQLDYCAHTTFDGIPIVLKPIGLFAEAVTLDALKRVRQQAREQKYFEHVTMFIYQHPELFNIKLIPLERDLDVDLRFTIDYPEDIDHCERLMQYTPGESREQLLGVLREHPDLLSAIVSFSRRHPKRY